MPPIANDPVMDVFAKLDLKMIALLLDVDGTIIDIGPSPTEVHVSDALVESLRRLFDLTGGAMALVSGRPISDLDRLFSPVRLPAVASMRRCCCRTRSVRRGRRERRESRNAGATVAISVAGC